MDSNSLPVRCTEKNSYDLDCVSTKTVNLSSRNTENSFSSEPSINKKIKLPLTINTNEPLIEEYINTKSSTENVPVLCKRKSIKYLKQKINRFNGEITSVGKGLAETNYWGSPEKDLTVLTNTSPNPEINFSPLDTVNWVSPTLRSEEIKKCKKIAIINGLYFHYECLGFFIEYSIYYLKKNNYENKKPTIYLKYHEDNGYFIKRDELLNWKQYYTNLFNLNESNWKTYEEIENDDIDILFLTTDDDFEFKSKWVNRFKIVSLNHLLTRRIYSDSSSFLNINIRYSNILNKDNERWSIPMFNALSCIEKKSILNNRNLPKKYDIHIVCIGTHSQPHPDQPKIMFKNNDKILFSVINRRIEHNYECNPNIDSYQFLNTPNFFNILANADYILCFNYNPDHSSITLSASINIAFSFGARLIIPNEWQEKLNIRSAISYKFSDGSFHVPSITSEMIDTLYQEREYFINHRNTVLDDAVNYLLSS
jgi:hypothetical protein